MGKVSIFLHKSVQDYADFIATLFDTSRSEVVEDMIKHIRDKDLEDDVWEGYSDLIEDLESSEEEEGSESEDETELESEEEEEEEEEE